MKEKIIFHIDVNSAYLSWEAIYRMKVLGEKDDLRLVPSIIGGSTEQRHGIVLAKSIPAKAYGIHTAQTIVSALNKCPDLVIVPPRFDIYKKYSNEFMAILEEYSPDIQKVSIDEAFIDMTETCHLFGKPMEAAEKIKNQIRDELGFTVNVGVSVNKLLAKMASDFEKPDLCHSLFPLEIEEKMWPLPVEQLYFVGRSAKKKMELLGIRTIGDLAKTDVELLKSHLGEKYGQQIYEYANGIADNNIIEEEPINKSYGNSTTLSHDVDDYQTACQVLLALSETVGSRLRAAKVKCNSITVEIKDTDFKRFSHQTTLDEPTDSTGIIYEKACRLLKEFWDGRPVRLIGISTSKVTEDDFTQLSLFPKEKNKKLEKLDMAIDKIRKKYGTDSVKRASFLDTNAVCNHTLDKKNRHE